MKLTTLLILGAAALATPALAQTDPNAPGVAGATSLGPNPGAPAPAQADAMPDKSMSSNSSTGMSKTGMTNTAMNSSRSTADLSSVPDTEKKYKASSRASDNKKEAEITRQLNQQMASNK